MQTQSEDVSIVHRWKLNKWAEESFFNSGKSWASAYKLDDY